MNQKEKNLSEDTEQLIELLKKIENNKPQICPVPGKLVQLLFDEYQKYWHPDNPTWMRERKLLWKHVLRNIKRLSYSSFDFKKTEMVLLKNFFFTGHFVYKEVWKSRLVDRILFFYFWLFPEEPTIEIMQPLFNSMLGYLSYPVGGFSVNNRNYPPPYGLMGGREKLFLDVFYPKTYWKETINISSLAYRPDGVSLEKEIPGCIRPENLLRSCCVDTRCLLIIPEYNPYSFGRYLWDKFDYNYEHHNEECYGHYSITDIPGIENAEADTKLVGVLNLIMAFYEHEETIKDSPLAVELRTELYERFEANGFSPRLQKVWEDIKRSRNITKPTKYFDWNKYSGVEPIKLEREK